MIATEGSISAGPDHICKFYPIIFGKDKQIRDESMDVFELEHTFSLLSQQKWQHWQSQDSEFSALATSAQAKAFQGVAITLDIDSAGVRERELIHDVNLDLIEWSHVVLFPAEDLRAVVSMLLHIIDNL